VNQTFFFFFSLLPAVFAAHPVQPGQNRVIARPEKEKVMQKKKTGKGNERGSLFPYSPS